VALGAGAVADQANTLSVGSLGSERRIANLAPGVNSTDAINVSQFNGLANDLSALRSDIGALRSDIGNVASSAYRGIAGVAALTAGTPAVPGKTSINLGVGAYKGYAAGALTASHTTENGRFNFNGGIGITSREPVYRAGIGFSF
jgi:autotransporter adhesin